MHITSYVTPNDLSFLVLLQKSEMCKKGVMWESAREKNYWILVATTFFCVVRHFRFFMPMQVIQGIWIFSPPPQ